MNKVQSMFDLTGQVAIVTGASKGLGESYAHMLAQAGADLFITARKKEGLERVSDEIRKEYGKKCFYSCADVSIEADCKRAAAECLEAYGRIDILINNAAAMRNNKPPQDTTPEEFEAVMHPNVTGTLMMANAVYPTMAKQHYGRIVNISSLSANIINKGVHGGSYDVSKAAVSHLTKALATEWAKDGICVNALAPGYYGTKPNLDFFAADPQFKGMVEDLIPMHRLGEPEELWGAMLLLCSRASSYMQGDVISIDGGYTIW